jgi:hypothetical protein
MAGNTVATGESLANHKNAARIRVSESSNIGAISLGENVLGYVSTKGTANTKGVMIASGSSTYPVTWTTASKDGIAQYTRSAATSGYTYGARFDHEIAGTGNGGAAVRAVGRIEGVTATDTYGVEATGEISSTASSTVSDGMTVAGVSSVCSLQLDPPDHAWCFGVVSRSNVATGKDATAALCCAFYATEDAGTGTGFNRLLSMRATIATDTPTAMVSTHADHASTHLVRCAVVNPSTYAVTDLWLMATNAH